MLAYFAKRGSGGNARGIVEAPAAARHRSSCRSTIPSPPRSTRTTTTTRARSPASTTQSADAVAEHLEAGRTVAVLSEGDPLFYGSYMHLHVRLAQRFPTEVIPGVTAMSGCWSLAGLPIVQGDDVLSVLPGTMAEAELTRRLADTEAAVIMKVGRNLPKIRRALAGGRQARRGRLCRARHDGECSDDAACRQAGRRGALFLAGAGARLGGQAMSGTLDRHRHRAGQCRADDAGGS